MTYWKTSSINSTVNSDLISAGITLRTKSYKIVFLGNSSLSSNNEKTANPLEIIEIQTGNYLGEDDIIRLEDDYERTLNS